MKRTTRLILSLKVSLVISLWGLATQALAQEEAVYAYQTFRDTRLINGHSVETGARGELKFIISHRFGPVNGGAINLFGLDQSTIRFGLDYGVNGKLDVGIGRSSFGKTYDGYLKYKLMHQRTGSKARPVTMVYLATTTINGEAWQFPDRQNYFSSRMSYMHQLLIARKFGPRFSMQVMPTLVHRNLVATTAETNDVLSLGVAGRLQLTRIIALQAEYYYTLPDQLAADRFNSFALGVEFQTKAHVFQVHLTNAIGMVGPLYITETTGRWTDNDIRLGFNISRDFKIGHRKFH